MQERSEEDRRAIWPCINVATWPRERSDRATSHTTGMLTSSNKNLKIIAGIEFFGYMTFRPIHFQPMQFQPLPFQPLTISTYCILNRPQFRPKLIWLMDPN